MANCSVTPHEYIQNAFAPQIAILCSEDADNVCLKNNLRFVELLQPFSKTSCEARICDPAGNSVVIKNFSVYFEDMNKRPPQPTLGKKILSEAVANAPWDQDIKKEIKSCGRGIDVSLDLQPTTPWYEVWRELFLQIQYPSDHEFTKHYIACIIVISAGSENAMEQLNRLSQYQHQQQHQNPGRFPKWFLPNILKYYVLLHDTDQVSSERANEVFEQMTSAYGPLNCHLLHINSRPLDQSNAHIPDPWAQYLKHKGFDGTGTGISSEVSSGTGTPKEDVVGLPSRVSEGDSPEGSDVMPHPLSPVASLPDDKDGVFENPPVDVPLLVNRQSLPSGIFASHHGACLTSSDIDRIKIFIDEFCLRTLIPYVERQVRYLNDVVTNRSRSKSLLSATRRWLGGSKSPSGGATSVIYGQEATELQTRRLGDLCFMFGLYELAYNAYYTAKNDFKSDQAWLYFAGAQEMAALSSFMQGSSDYPKRYLEGSLHTYLNVCKVYNFAIRLTLLSSEVFKHHLEFGEAAMMFIKMTSEESDLLSALMLEQAAHCFINSKRPLPRKYAFHMTLAGHRYGKAGQRAHSYRSYKQAFQIYYSRGWTLAEDHIHYSMGKQTFHLKQILDSLQATERLINQTANNDTSSQQSATQQTAYMREYLNILDKYLKEECKTSDILALPVPILNSQSTKVIVGTPQDTPADKEWSSASHVSFLDDESREKRWFALEKESLSVSQGHQMIFHPNLHRLTNATPNSVSPYVPNKELISIRIILWNPMFISLTLSCVRPLYKFIKEGSEDCTENGYVTVETVPGFNIPPQSEETVILNMWPQEVGQLQITGVAFTLCLTSDMVDSSRKVAVEGKLNFHLKGPRLNNTLAEKSSVIYAKDERLNIRVIPPMPRLQVSLKDPPVIMSCGELKSVSICLQNVGPTPLSNLIIASSSPQHIIFCVDNDSIVTLENDKFPSVTNMCDTQLQNRVERIHLQNGVVNHGEKITGHLWFHAPLTPGAFDVELLFYYEPCNYPLKNTYRSVRHLSSVFLYPSIGLSVNSFRMVNVLPKLSEEGQHLHSSNLVFHIKNKCEIENAKGTVEILAVGAISRSWKIIPHSTEELLRIDVNENSQLCFRCIHIHREDKDKSLLYSYIPLTIPVPCWWNFMLRERLKFLDLLADSPSSNSSAVLESSTPTKNELDATSTLDMIVTLVWKAHRGEEIINGQHSLYLEKLGQSESVPSSKDWGFMAEEKPPVRIIPDEEPNSPKAALPALTDQQNLVIADVHCPKEIIHNFKKDPLCRITYTVNLYNSCACEIAGIIDFSSKPSTEGSSVQMFSPQACSNLLMVGASVRKICLPPWQLVEVKIDCIVTCPGTYCLGAFTLKVQHLKSKEWINQVCQFQNGVVVVRTDNHASVPSLMSSQLFSIPTSSNCPTNS